MKLRPREGPLISRNNPTLSHSDPTDLSRIIDATKAWIQTLHLTTAWAGSEIESLFHPLKPGLQHTPQEHKWIDNKLALYNKQQVQ